ncbi:MAG: precorrin-6Y C5,15-methyltransferase (decarboxylating) subunit CbiT, partial [Lachnospiraceae bacterium]|nr:precorrin-6Y C5,15-methyltransferase (decarboxylating) subunit CbiT [Lachnospiraceae bacterium]
REVSICKLKLYEGAVVYDIGSGTGSIAVEIAGLSDEIKVFALEYKEEAISLIAQNKEKFELNNIEIVSGKAPDGLEELPVPTHAFIGGSGGRMKEILSVLYQKNSQMRVVINSISMETICEIKEVLSTFSIQNADVVQMQVSRAKSVGAYHLMQAENPVWICSFDFSG